MRSLLWSFVMLSPMKLRGQSTIDALILTAALNNEFGVTRASLAEQLAVHYTPVNSMLAKYKLRLEEGKMKTRDHARRILKETYANSKSKLSLFAASFLLLENSFMHLHDCLLEALPC